MGESVNDRGTDTETGEGAGAGHKSDFGDVAPIFIVCL